jgi:hypothetical protein
MEAEAWKMASWLSLLEHHSLDPAAKASTYKKCMQDFFLSINTPLL